MGNGNRTRNRRSHSPVLCQLSYSHRQRDYSNCGSGMSERPHVASARALIGQSLLRCEATPNGVNQMSERGVGHIEESRRETIDNSRERKGKAGIWAWPLGLLFRTGEFFVHRSWENLVCRQFLYPHGPRTIVGSTHPRPTPTYSNPMARSRVESSRFFVSTMIGFFSRCLMRSKSRARNSGQPVPTTNASIPSAAA